MMERKLKKIYGSVDCPIRNVLDRVGDKWSILVIMLLGENGTLRFNELDGLIETISQKMLTVTLKTLEADGLIVRKVYAQVPPRVEYTLTKPGKSLLPAVATLAQWADKNMPSILTARTRYEKSNKR